MNYTKIGIMLASVIFGTSFMYIRRQIRFKHLLNDSWLYLLLIFSWSLLAVYIHEIVGVQAIEIPILPVTTIGIAVSLYLGFKSSQAYARWWEARKIWGEIINNSRSWANYVESLIFDQNIKTNANIQRDLIYRHLAWVNALVYQLHQTSILIKSKKMRFFDYRYELGEENYTQNTNQCYKQYLDEPEFTEIISYHNPAVNILKNQAQKLRKLREEGYLDNYRHVAMISLLSRFNDAQGSCERIKNTPFPRQIAYFGTLFTRIFIFLIPLAFLDVFEQKAIELSLSKETHLEYIFTSVPFAMVVSWVFFMMEKISDTSEDPFEGGVTDVPISAISRTIEIDLKQYLKDRDIPKPLAPIEDTLY